MGVFRPSLWLCAGCCDELVVDYVLSLRLWLVEELDERVRLVSLDHCFVFYFRLLSACSGEVVRDEQSRPVPEIVACWTGAGRFFEDVYFHTGGRILSVIFEGVVFDYGNREAFRWTRIQSKFVKTGGMCLARFSAYANAVIYDWFPPVVGHKIAVGHA